MDSNSMEDEAKTKYWIWLKSFAVLTVLVVLVLIWWGRQGSDATDRLPITIGAYKGDTSALVYVALEQGFIDEAGLDMTLMEFESGKQASDALSAGEVDVATSADFVLTKKVFTEPELRVLATVAGADTVHLIGRRDRGISEPAELKGKTIGITNGSVGEFFLGSFLDFHGLTMDDLKIESRFPSGLVEGVISGELDAVMTWEPNVYNIRNALGENAVSFPGQTGQRFYFVLLAKDHWLENHGETARRLLKALHRAELHVLNHQEQLHEMVKRRFGGDDQYVANVLQAQDLELQLPQALLTTLEAQARWMQYAGLTSARTMPNFLDVIYQDAMYAVAPDSITVAN